MKKYIIFGAVIAILIGIIATTTSLLVRYRKIALRNENNYEAVVGNNRALQQQLTAAELKKYYPEIAETIKEQGIKPKNVQNIVQVKYSYIDTTIRKDTLVYIFDTIRKQKSADFRIIDSCLKVAGKVNENGTIEITTTEFSDKITTVLFKYRKCLFNRWKYKAMSISQCTGDTLKIENNIKITKTKKGD